MRSAFVVIVVGLCSLAECQGVAPPPVSRAQIQEMLGGLKLEEPPTPNSGKRFWCNVNKERLFFVIPLKLANNNINKVAKAVFEKDLTCFAIAIINVGASDSYIWSSGDTILISVP